MATALERTDRDLLAAIVERHPVTPHPDAQTVRVDAALLAVASALLAQFAAAFAEEPIGPAGATVAGRLQNSVPLSAVQRLKKDMDAVGLAHL